MPSAHRIKRNSDGRVIKGGSHASLTSQVESLDVVARTAFNYLAQSAAFAPHPDGHEVAVV